jgi:hypothetical protein
MGALFLATSHPESSQRKTPKEHMTISQKPLQTRLVQHLQVDPAQHPRGKSYLSAASGLVRWRQRLYVVADDELHLGVFDDSTVAGLAAPPGALVRLLEGDLPRDKGKRKKVKPDLETLALLPPLPGCPAGALLALGSGSKPQRESGVLVALDIQGAPNGRMALVDLSALYAPLHKRFEDLNIEGAIVLSGELLLLHRGNQGDSNSACIRFDWNLLAPWLAGLQPKPPSAKSVQLMQLGSVGGVPLSLTDGTALHGGAWAFSAVAESTDDSYLDGACVGSAIGIVATDGQIQCIYPLEGAPKVEGIAVLAQGDEWVFTLVTDPDDPKVPAQLLQAHVAQEF